MLSVRGNVLVRGGGARRVRPSERTSQSRRHPWGLCIGYVLPERQTCDRLRPLRANSDFEQETGAGGDLPNEAYGNKAPTLSPEDIAWEMAEQLQADGDDDTVSSRGTKITALPGSVLVLALSLAVTAASGAMGVDVFARAALPDDLSHFVTSCTLWTLPAMLYTGAFWYYILYRANSGAADVLKAEVQDTRYVVEDESISSIAVASGMLAIAEGLLFRGVGIAVASDLFAGYSLPKPPANVDDFLLNTVPYQLPILDTQVFPDHHLPDMWVWPFIALASGAIETTLVTLSQDGLKQMDKEFLVSMVSTGLMTETTEAQFVRTNDEGRLVVHKHGEDFPAHSISLDGLLLLSEYLADEFGAQQIRQRNIYVGPALFLARGTFLSAETILTGSLFTSLVTGAACYAIESVMSQIYLVKWDTGSSDNYRDSREISC